MQEGACKQSMHVVVTDADKALMQSCTLCMDSFGILKSISSLSLQDRKQHFVRCTSRASGVSRATGIESVDSAGRLTLWTQCCFHIVGSSSLVLVPSGATSKSASGASETEESEAYDGFFGSWRRHFSCREQLSSYSVLELDLAWLLSSVLRLQESHFWNTFVKHEQECARVPGPAYRWWAFCPG